MAALPMDQTPFVVIYWRALGVDVALALYGGAMHLIEPRLRRWKVRVDEELAEAAAMARQRREQDALADEAMEKIRAAAAAELAKVERVRCFATVVDPLQCVRPRR